jgi:hypothetical protein
MVSVPCCRALQVPSWGVALVFVCFLLVGLVVEHTVHWLEVRWRRRGQPGLLRVLEAIKTELVVVGIISLVLTFVEVRLGMRGCGRTIMWAQGPGGNHPGGGAGEGGGLRSDMG